MKQILISSTFLLLVTAFSRAAEEKTIQAPMDEVIVYASGAEIKRSATVSLAKGLNTVVITDLSNTLDVNSIQAGGKGNFTLLSLNARPNYLNQKPKPKELLLLEDSLKFYNVTIAKLQARNQALNEEQDLIKSNKNMKGEDSNLTAAELEAMAALYRKRLEEIYVMQVDIKEEDKRLRKLQQRVQNQINDLNQGRNKSVQEIVLELLADKAGSVELSLQYLVSNARWTPSYDVRSSSASDKVKVKYYAYITQATGVNWDKVPVKLSTSLPQRNNVKPELHPWVLDFVQRMYDERVDPQSNRRFNYASPAAMEADDELSVDGIRVRGARSAADFVQTIEGQLNLMYSIDLPYVIPSDNKSHMVHIRDIELPATFKHYAAPKLDRDAFLVAEVTGWDEYNLLPAQSRVFFDNMYIGNSYINTKSTEDTLKVSLGRNRNINIERKRIKDFSEKKVIGGNKKETIGIEVKVRNSQSIPVAIMIEDQIPISSNNDIDVELVEAEGAKHTKESGLLQWDLALEPNETKVLRFVYSVKYPKDKRINL